MNEREAGKLMMKFLTSCDLVPDQYVDINFVASSLIDKGLNVDNIERAFVAGFNYGWLKSLDISICFTDTGFAIFNPANDNASRGGGLLASPLC